MNEIKRLQQLAGIHEIKVNNPNFRIEKREWNIPGQVMDINLCLSNNKILGQMYFDGLKPYHIIIPQTPENKNLLKTNRVEYYIDPGEPQSIHIKYNG
jgi:hypothetical protein